jgi:hypothetical protein
LRASTSTEIREREREPSRQPRAIMIYEQDRDERVRGRVLLLEMV